MEFFNMDFSIMFKEKHGDKLFNEICDLIKQERAEEYNEIYVPIIFKIAFLAFFGLGDLEISNLIKDTKPQCDVNVRSIKLIHKGSIGEIQKYLKKSAKEQGDPL